MMADFTLRPLQAEDSNRVAQFCIDQWGAETVVAHGEIYYPHRLPGFVAEQEGQWVGLLTYRIEDEACEVMTIDSLRPSQGIGSALVEAVKGAARRAGCRRLWLITTNDNLNALRFYQKRGFVLAAVYPNALAVSRRLKPQIPLIGNDGIPLRDEIELEMMLDEER